MNKKRLIAYGKLLLKLVFTIAALWLVYSKVDMKALLVFWQRANGWWLVPAFGAFVLSQLVSSVRLLQFFRNIGLDLTWWYTVRLYLLGMFYSLFLPGGIGGDGYKIIKVKKEFDRPARQVFIAVFFDRLSGLWALGCLLIIFSLFIPFFDQYVYWAMAAMIAGTGAYYYITKRYFKPHSARFIRTHLLALLVQSCQLICVSFVLHALGYGGGYLPYLFSFLVSSLATLFPFSIGGLGAREVAIVWTASALGLDENLSVSVSLCFYCISTLLSLSSAVLLFKPLQQQKAAADSAVT